jgi:ERCC4-type nuclease
MIHLIIDNREHALIKLLNANSIPHTVEMLEIGDIMFRNGEETVLVIERKTVNDLKASICDGRGREQKARLLNCGLKTSRVMYLIEGKLSMSLDSKVSGVPVSTLIGSIINTQLRDDIKVYKTSTIDESVNFIQRLLEKLESDGSVYFKSETSSMNDGSYASTLKTRKKDNITPSVWFISQLAMIPQVTELIAVEIIKVYPNVSSIIKAYEECSTDKDRTGMLADITYPIKNDKVRRIGIKISERIYNLFYGIS